MKSLLIVTLFFLLACGRTGPQGAPGPQGPQGEPGPAASVVPPTSCEEKEVEYGTCLLEEYNGNVFDGVKKCKEKKPKKSEECDYE